MPPNSSTYPRIALFPGNGIGQEVAYGSLPLLRDLFPGWQITEGRIGWDCWCSGGDSVPPETWELARNSDALLVGAITSKPAREAERELVPELRGTGLTYRSPVVQLRRELDLYANVRPTVDLAGKLDFTVVRENTEGTYVHDLDADHLGDLAGVIGGDPTVRRADPREIAVALRITTGFAWRRLLRTCGALARRSRGHVTVADKPNIMQATGEVVRTAMDDVAREFPDVEFELGNADAVAMAMASRPGDLDIIAAENLIGDILSDLGAGLGAGLGVTPSANHGDGPAMFEPVHGSAPDIAGRGIANPAAFLLSAAMCGDHVGDADAAARLRTAVRGVLRDGDPTELTPDLGGRGTTETMLRAVANRLG